MSAPQVQVVRTGVANVASVLAGLRRAGADPHLTQDPDAVESADLVLLPGVGAFGAALRELSAHGLDEALRRRATADRRTLAICVGLQVLCNDSGESPGVPGLGIADASVARFPAGVTVPQFGWNRITPAAGIRRVPEGFAYFANSYRVVAAPPGWEVVTAEHGGPFVAAMERGAWTACQFHPELSGALGAELLRRFVGGDSC